MGVQPISCFGFVCLLMLIALTAAIVPKRNENKLLIKLQTFKQWTEQRFIRHELKASLCYLNEKHFVIISSLIYVNVYVLVILEEYLVTGSDSG